MGPRRVRRRIREYLTRDWLEIAVAFVGGLFLLFAAVFAFATVYLAVHFADEAPELPVSGGFLTGDKIVGIGFFAVAALVTFLVGKNLVGERLVRATGRAIRRRRGGSG